MYTSPAEFVPEYPQALHSEITSSITTRQSIRTGEKVQPYIDRATSMFKQIVTDAFLARELGRETPADTAAVPVVDDHERTLRLGRVGVADVASDPDRAAGLLLERDDGLAAAAADVDEVLHLPLRDPGRHRAQVGVGERL